MAATYPDLLAKGSENLGRYDQFDLYAGERDIVSSQGQAADGQAIQQFQVLTLDAAGRYIPLSLTGDYATGTITVGGQPVDTETVTINGAVITFIAAGTPTATQVLIGADTAATAANLAGRINSAPDTYDVSASVAGNVVTLTANMVGTAGNAITLAEAVANVSFTLSGATLTGANAAEDVPSGNAVAIAAQAVAAATPGSWLPVYIGGAFNHEALVWPAGMNTLAQRKLLFAGTPIHVTQLL